MRTIAICLLAVLTALPASLLAQTDPMKRHGFGLSIMSARLEGDVDHQRQYRYHTQLVDNTDTETGLGLSYRYRAASNGAFQVNALHIDGSIALDGLGLYIVERGGAKWHVGGGLSAVLADDIASPFDRYSGANGQTHIGGKIVGGVSWQMDTQTSFTVQLEYYTYGKKDYRWKDTGYPDMRFFEQGTHPNCPLEPDPPFGFRRRCLLPTGATAYDDDEVASIGIDGFALTLGVMF